MDGDPGIRQFSGRLLRDLDRLVSRTHFAGSAKQAADVESLLDHLLGDSADIVKRRVALPGNRYVLVTFIDGLVAAERVDLSVLRPLARWDPPTPSSSIVDLERSGIFVGETRVAHEGGMIVQAVLSGDAVVAASWTGGAVIVSVRHAQGRQVESPLVEISARGPRDSFVETARTNVALIRRRIADPNLRVRRHTVGVRTRTDVYLLYLDDVVNRQALQELEKRLNSIQIDAILDSGMLEQLIEDNWWTPFPQAQRTERPDVAAAALLEGRLCLVVDNTPLAVVAPTTLNSLFHSPEDTYDRPALVTALRLVRFLASVLAITLPALYVSVVSFNPGLLPAKLAITITRSREGVALPVVAEALLMQLFLEILREAGFRLPGPIGQTFGIVGGIILSELGVRAGLVSEMMVVVMMSPISFSATPGFGPTSAFS